MIRFDRIGPSVSKLARATDVPFRFGRYIERGFEIFSKAPGGMVGVAAVYVGASFVIALLNSIFPLPGLQIVLSAAIYPILSGLTIQAYYASTRGRASFERGFDFTPYFGRLMGLAFVDVAITVIVFVGVFLGGLLLGFAGDFTNVIESGTSSIGLVYGIIGILLVALLLASLVRCLFYFSTHFVMFYNMDVMESLKASYRLTVQHYWGVLGLSVLSVVIGVLGMLACYVGVLAAYPVIYAIGYAAFEYLALFDKNENESDDVIQHLLDL